MISCPVLSLSIDTDTLYHPRLQVDLADLARGAGLDTDYVVVESAHGHDGFLLEISAVGDAIGAFLQKIPS